MLLTRKSYNYYLLLPIILLSVMLQSCEPDEPVRGFDVAISFASSGADASASGPMGAPSRTDADSDSRRAPSSTTPAENYFDQFRVFAVKNMDDDMSAAQMQTVIDGYIVSHSAGSAYTTSSNTADWDYVGNYNNANQTIKYWDFSAKAYRFFAVAEANAALANNGSSKIGPVDKTAGAWSFKMQLDASSETAIAAMPYASKLAYVESGNYGQQVQMQFYKPLSKVRFILLDETGQVLEDNDIASDAVSVVGFAPLNAPQKIFTSAKATVSYPVTGTAQQESWSFDYTGATSVEKMTEPYVASDKLSDCNERATAPEHWYTFVPNPTQGEYQLMLNVGGAEKTAVVPAAYMQWQPNMSYTYRFKVSEDIGGGIIFVGVAVKDWAEADAEQAIDHPVYNW